ncbi:MAG: DUF6526 family protein [Thermoanaerobaculia bacterium]
MAENSVQVYANHRRWDPWYHFFAFPVVSIALVVALWTFIRSLSAGFSFWALWYVVVSAATVVLALKLRSYALKDQDRIIRVEERLRLATVLDGSLKARIGELDVRQLTGLRFAADAEVPALVKAALDEKLSGEEIKKRIRDWRPDTFRV